MLEKPFKPLSVKNDFVFKLIFGDQRNTDILAGFLKSILDVPEDEYETLHIVDPNVKKEALDDKYGILDVKIRTKKGSVVHVEIQVDPIPEIAARVLYYQSKMVTEQLKAGSEYSEIKRVVSIIITDFDIPGANSKYFHRFRYRSDDGLEFTGLSEINTLELSKLSKEAEDNDLWYWTKFISSNDEEVLKMVAERSPVMEKAVGVLMELSADEVNRMIAENIEKARRDNVSRMNGARQEGRQEGMLEGTVKVVIKLLKMGRPIEEISEATELSFNEIERIRAKEKYVRLQQN